MKKTPVIVFVQGLLKPFNIAYKQWVYKVGKTDKEGRSLYSAISILPETPKKTPQIPSRGGGKEG